MPQGQEVSLSRDRQTMCYSILQIVYSMSQCFPSVPLRSNDHLQGCKKRHQPIVTTETPFLWMRKLPPSKRPSPKRDVFLQDKRKYNKRLLGTLPQSQWCLLLKEEQAFPLHLLDLDGPKGRGKSLKNWEISTVNATLWRS